MPNRYFGRLRRSEQVLLDPPAAAVPPLGAGQPSWRGGDIVGQLVGAGAKTSLRATGGMVGCIHVNMAAGDVPADGADTATHPPDAPRLINVLIKMHSQLAGAMPEIGIVVAPRRVKNVSEPAVCRIKQVLKGSAAAAAGNLRPGDIIKRVNMVDVSKHEPEEIVSILRKAAIDCKWTYSPVRLQVARDSDNDSASPEEEALDINLMELMSIAIKKNSRMVASKKPNPIRHTLLQRAFCDRLDRALAEKGYYDVSYTI